MGLSNGTGSIDAMLEAQSQIYHHVIGILGPMSLKCALDLEIFDIIHAHGLPMTISGLLSKLPSVPPTKAPPLRRIMRLLAQMGYFQVIIINTNNCKQDEEGEESYSLTLLSELLLKGRPMSIRPWTMGALSPTLMTDVAPRMSEWLQSDQANCNMLEFAHGKSMRDLAKGNAEFNLVFNEMMAGDVSLVVRAVVEKCKEIFQGLGSVVDVGGGTGTVARTIKAAFPGLQKCMFYDLPHVIAAAPVDQAVEGIGGDMFQHVPKADAILLSAILHDWNDEECVKILKNCKEAISEKTGKVIIIDLVVKDRRSSREVETQLFWDIGMMVSMSGTEREEHEWNKLFMESGFTRYKIYPVGLRSLIEVFP